MDILSYPKRIDTLQEAFINPQSHVEHFLWWMDALLLDFHWTIESHHPFAAI